MTTGMTRHNHFPPIDWQLVRARLRIPFTSRFLGESKAPNRWDSVVSWPKKVFPCKNLKRKNGWRKLMGKSINGIKEFLHTEVRAPSTLISGSPSIELDEFVVSRCLKTQFEDWHRWSFAQILLQNPRDFLEHATQNIGRPLSQVACVCEIRASLASAAPFYVWQVGARLNGGGRLGFKPCREALEMGGALKCLRGGVWRKIKNAVEFCEDQTKHRKISWYAILGLEWYRWLDRWTSGWGWLQPIEEWSNINVIFLWYW